MRRCNFRKKLSTIVPDVLFISGKSICIIEIAVTHFVDKIKEQKIRELGLPTLEIDLSKYYGKKFTRKEIENEIINGIENKRWLYYPNLENLILKANLEYKKKIDEIEYKKQETEKRAQKNKEILIIQQKRYYINKLRQYRSDFKTKESIKKFHFSKDLKKTLSFFLDIPISGEIVFKCDRRIRQSALFDQFIYYRSSSKKCIVSTYNIYQWIGKRQSFFELDWYAIKNEMGNAYRVIEQYLTYMYFLGFISELHQQDAVLLHSHTLAPPIKEHACLLYTAISSIEALTQNPNKAIENYLIDAYGIFLSKKKEMEYHLIQSYKK